MVQIGVLSDTHGCFDDSLRRFFEPVSEIWHAGDIGNIETANALKAFKNLRAVHGNIDGHELRVEFPAVLQFHCEQVSVLLTHIGGYPGRYEAAIRPHLLASKPKLFICGHSHILKVINDKKMGLLHINPGAAGNSGFHRVRTAVRFVIDGNNIKDLEVLEIERQ